MAAGLGFKDFTTGEVLTAADVDGYLMQGIWVFASNAARDAAVTAPAEGNFAFTKDTNSLWYYDGAAWVASGATGDIEGVTAGVGISGGGTSGTVTVTNSMATAITTAGDTLYGTGSGTFSRLGIGTAGQVLKVNSGATAPEWGAAASGALTLVKTQTIGSGVSSVAVTSAFSSTYDNYLITVSGGVGSALAFLQLQLGSQTSGYYGGAIKVNFNNTVTGVGDNGATQMSYVGWCSSAAMCANIVVNSPNLDKTTTVFAAPIVDGNNAYSYSGQSNSATQFTGFTIKPDTGTITGGTIRIYGYSNS
jgi:hypothetical protein